MLCMKLEEKGWDEGHKRNGKKVFYCISVNIHGATTGTSLTPIASGQARQCSPKGEQSLLVKLSEAKQSSSQIERERALSKDQLISYKEETVNQNIGTQL